MSLDGGTFRPRAQSVEEALLVCASTPEFAGWYVTAAGGKDENLSCFDSTLLPLIESERAR